MLSATGVIACHPGRPPPGGARAPRPSERKCHVEGERGATVQKLPPAFTAHYGAERSERTRIPERRITVEMSELVRRILAGAAMATLVSLPLVDMANAQTDETDETDETDTD